MATKKNLKIYKVLVLAVLFLFTGIIIAMETSESSNVSTIQQKQPKDKVIILTDKTFEETVKKGVTLVDFWAIWCGPCKTQGPIIDKVADEIGTKAKICKLDTDKNPLMSNKYNVTMIPTILIFKDGKVVHKFVGVQQKEVLLKKVKEYL